MKLKDIATLTNLSVATISRVINKQDGVSNKNREKIERILLENGYYKRQKKFSQKIGLKKVALVLPDLKNPFFGEIAKETSDKLREFGYQTVIFNTNEDYSVEKEVIETIIKLEDISGVIICITSGTNSLKSIEILKDYCLPFVMIDRELAFHQDGIFMDDFKAGFLATESLIKKGHLNIGIINGDSDLANVYNRFQGYLHALKQYNISYNKNYVFYCNLNTDSNFIDLKDVLKKETMITALVTINNSITVSLLKLLKQKEFKKRKIAITAIGRFDYFELLQQPIDFIDWDIKGMSIASVNLLIKKFNMSNLYTQKIIFEPTIIYKK